MKKIVKKQKVNKAIKPKLKKETVNEIKEDVFQSIAKDQIANYKKEYPKAKVEDFITALVRRIVILERATSELVLRSEMMLTLIDVIRKNKKVAKSKKK
jgi:hypothetical protein